jgi:hypothetical protein
MSALPTATLTLTVGKFVDVLASTAPAHRRNTECTVEMTTGHPRVVMGADGQKKLPSIKVKGGKARLCFKLKSKNPEHRYFPLGIAFLRRGKINASDAISDVLGRDDFSFDSVRLSRRSLFITDSFKDCGPHGSYKFSVIIQREHDGAIGIIDPGIENEP